MVLLLEYNIFVLFPPLRKTARLPWHLNRDVQRVPQGQGLKCKINGQYDTNYWSRVWIHYYFCNKSLLWSSSLHLFHQNVYILLKYILCNADLLAMLEPVILFSGFFDE